LKTKKLELEKAVTNAQPEFDHVAPDGCENHANKRLDWNKS
jgi:hypothetical protein